MHSLILLAGLLPVASRLEAQSQFFSDETDVRLPAWQDRSLDAGLGDLDGDGDLDVVVTSSEFSTLRSYRLLNDGAGFFPVEDRQILPLFVASYSSVAFGDIEMDADLDLLFTAFDGQLRLLVNQEGSLVDESAERLPGHSPIQATEGSFVDVDGDLSLDVAIIQYGSDWIWENDGNGFFGIDPGRFPSGFHYSNAFAWGDVDGDFDLDCVIANNTGQENRLMINDGSGWFGDQTSERLPEDLGQSNGVVLVDLNGDNALDIVIANGFSPGDNKIWINDGSGVFSDESELRYPQGGHTSSGLAAGDIDNDGDVDLLIANRASGGDANKVLVNDGVGYFADETSTRYPDITDDESNEIKVGDVDGDGDLDCLVVNDGVYPDGQQNRLLINHSSPDSFPPVIPRTFQHPDTPDTSKPYLITTTVWDNVSVVVGEIKGSLFYQVWDNPSGEARGHQNPGGFTEIPMVDCGGFLYRERIPAQRNGKRVEYYVRAEDRMGNVSFDPPGAPDSVYSFVVDVSLGIGGDPGVVATIPRAFSLSQNYPNPFNPSTTIDYSVPEGGEVLVDLCVYDIRGRLIRSLAQGERAPGAYSVHWDGMDENGEPVGSGIYLYRLGAGPFVSTKKMLIIR